MESLGDILKTMPELRRPKPIVAPKVVTPAAERLLTAAVEIRTTSPDAIERAFMARQLVQCTLPHSNPGNVPVWTRRNGNVLLTLQPGSRQGRLLGYPYGVLPRLLLFWLVTEAVQGKHRRIYLGKSLAALMRQLGLDPGRGGRRSDATRLKDQMDRLFRARIGFERFVESENRTEDDWVDMPVGSATHLRSFFMCRQ